MSPLAPDEIAARLTGLDGWRVDSAAITKTYVLATFHRAIGFVVQIAMLADAADHHPDIDIRYNRITVTLSTHSAGGVTDKDFALAARIDGASTDAST